MVRIAVTTKQSGAHSGRGERHFVGFPGFSHPNLIEIIIARRVDRLTPNLELVGTYVDAAIVGSDATGVQQGHVDGACPGPASQTQHQRQTKAKSKS